MIPKNKEMVIEMGKEKDSLAITITGDGYGWGIDDAEKLLQASLEGELILNPKLIKLFLYTLDIRMSNNINPSGKNKLILNIPYKVKRVGGSDRKCGSNVVSLHAKT